MRLDKFLTECKNLTRKEAKKLIQSGQVFVDEECIKKPEFKVEETQCVQVSGEVLSYQKFVYYMLNKPAGVISATSDNRDTTVVDLMENGFPVGRKIFPVGRKIFPVGRKIFPVGRLDKDTEGLLLMTDDGELAHQLLSPKKHVDKTYYVRVDQPLCKEDVVAFEKGMDIGEKHLTLPAKLELCSEDTAYVTICEGKFHQIKRMFLHQGKKVVYLKRIRMGTLILDDTLQPGEFRMLTEKEMKDLKGTE